MLNVHTVIAEIFVPFHTCKLLLATDQLSHKLVCIVHFWTGYPE